MVSDGLGAPAARPAASFWEAFAGAGDAHGAVPGSFRRAAQASGRGAAGGAAAAQGGGNAPPNGGAGFHAPASGAGGNASASAAPGSAPHSCVLVHPRQKGNPLLAHIRHVRWRFADTDQETPLADYEVGPAAYVAFVSMRYHLLHPEYTMRRLEQMPRAHRGATGARLRVLVCHVDVDDEAEPLRELGLIATRGGATLLCGWSHAECARYVEALKAFDGKTVDAVAGKTERDYLSRLVQAFYAIRGVNRTDATSLVGRLGSLAAVLTAPKVRLESVPGVGATKATRLFDAFRAKFYGGGKVDPTATVNLGAAKAPPPEEGEEGIDGGDEDVGFDEPDAPPPPKLRRTAPLPTSALPAPPTFVHDPAEEEDGFAEDGEDEDMAGFRAL